MAQFPTFGNATGVWNINDVYNNVSGGTWPNFGAIALFAGGNTPAVSDITDQVTISTLGNATVFGDLTAARSQPAGIGSLVRGIFGGGYISASPGTNIIDYFTFSNTGNAADFGDLTVARDQTGGASNSTRGTFGGGYLTSNVIDFITMASIGNATDFGNLLVGVRAGAGAASATRGLFGGGYFASPISGIGNIIEFITFATTSNATDFGDLSQARRNSGATSSQTRALFAGGFTPTQVNTIDYVTISSAGNAADFGDLTQVQRDLGGTSNSVRGLFGGGSSGPLLTSVINTVNIASLGNATSFGNLTSQRAGVGAASNAHGGLSDGYQGTRPAVFFGQGQRGIFATSITPAPGSRNNIEFITISTAGNATDFGDATNNLTFPAAAGNETRSLFGPSERSAPVGYSALVDYVVPSTLGNAANFGSLTLARSQSSGLSNSTRAVFGGGFAETPGNTWYNVIDYLEISSLGNGADFGDLTVALAYPAAAGSPTRGAFAGGYTPTIINVIQYITIATTGNATDFGDLTSVNLAGAGLSSSTRALFGGGETPTKVNTIDYITIATTGNALDFGDLTQARSQLSATSNGTTGVFAGGQVGPAGVNTIDFVTIATLGNATDFGDLGLPAYGGGGTSNGHGGLNGATTPATPDRGLFKTGPQSAPTYSSDNVIEFINIASSGNASDFGDLTAAGYILGTGIASSNTQGIFFGTGTGPFTNATNVINIISISTLGNASDFGDLTVKNIGGGGLSNQVRGIYGGGFPSPGGFPNTNTIQFITIQSLGNTIDFGDLTQVVNEVASTASPTRGVWAGGNSSPVAPANTTNVIGYVTIATTGNALDFGDLTQTMRGVQGLSSNTRGIFAGSGVPVANVINFITIASTGNATDFGDLLSSVNQTIPSSNSITGLFAGGSVSPSEVATNVINAITIASAGDATDFGDLTRAGRVGAGASGSQGGLQ